MVLFLIVNIAGWTAEKKSPSLKIEWQGDVITFSDSDPFLEYGRVHIDKWSDKKKGRREIDCLYASFKTKCFYSGIRKGKYDPYGVDLLYSHPIAIFLETANFDKIQMIQREITYNDVKDKKFIKSLAKYKVIIPSDDVINTSPDKYEALGTNTESHVYAPVDMAIGGVEYLEAWRSLIGKMPKKYCTDFYDSCSVVVNSSWGGKTAISYCLIFNSSVGIGIPFLCSVVAFEEDSHWWILSYNSPELSGGKGAAGGAACNLRTNKSLNEIKAMVIHNVKESKMNIDLKTDKEDATHVDLSGKNTAIDSRFFQGYYEKSFATFSIYFEPEEGGAYNDVMISGFFNLDVSAEPSKNGIDYHDVSSVQKDGEESDEEWFQRQVSLIIKDFLRKEDKDVSCDSSRLIL